MVIRYILLAFFGIGAGAVTAAGYFAVIAAVGVVTRFAEYTKTASKIRIYEIKNRENTNHITHIIVCNKSECQSYCVKL